MKHNIVAIKEKNLESEIETHVHEDLADSLRKRSKRRISSPRLKQ